MKKTLVKFGKGAVLSLFALSLFAGGANSAQALSFGDLVEVAKTLKISIAELSTKLAASVYYSTATTAVVSSDDAVDADMVDTTVTTRSVGTSVSYDPTLESTANTSSTSTATTQASVSSSTTATSVNTGAVYQETQTTTDQNTFSFGSTSSIETSAVSAPVTPAFVPASISTPVAVTVPDVSIRTASRGSSGANVLAIQNILVAQGYLDTDLATGYFGAKTEAAVKSFQSANGIATVGTVGPQTAARLSVIGTTGGTTASGTESGTGTTVPITKPSGCILPAGKAAWIRIVSPNGGEKYMPGDAMTVTWAHCGVSSKNVSISFFPTTAAGVATGPIVLLSASTPNDGTEQFTLATNSLAGFYKAHIVAIGGTETDISDNPYQIIIPKLYIIAGTKMSGLLATVSSSTNGINYSSITTNGPATLPSTQGVYFGNALWIVGGVKFTSPNTQAPSNEIWKSTNGGISWSQVDTDSNTAGIQNAPWSARFSPQVFVFNNKMWVISGQSDFNNLSSSIPNDIWSSSDGITWVHVDTNPNISGIQNAPWLPRVVFSSSVLNNKMYVFGGMGVDSGSSIPYYRDAWSSSDGITWTQISAATPVESGAGLVVHNSKMYLLNASLYNQSGAKIYSSSDGISWKLETSSVPWAYSASSRYSYTPVSFKGKIWIIGGGNEIFEYDDVWSSPDGITWTPAVLNLPSFMPRQSYAAIID